MPGFDRTGPLGAGPKTGWGRGRCVPGAGAGQAPSGGGFAQGAGRGGAPFGGGRGRCFGGRGLWGAQAWQGQATESADEVQGLKNQLDDAQRAVRELQDRLSELEKQR